jgi:hypothetical protein
MFKLGMVVAGFSWATVLLSCRDSAPPAPTSDPALFEVVVRAIVADSTIVRPVLIDPRPLGADSGPDGADSATDALVQLSMVDARRAVLTKLGIRVVDDASRQGCSGYSGRGGREAANAPSPCSSESTIALSLPRPGQLPWRYGNPAGDSSAFRQAWITRVRVAEVTATGLETKVYDVVVTREDGRWVVREKVRLAIVT